MMFSLADVYLIFSSLGGVGEQVLGLIGFTLSMFSLAVICFEGVYLIGWEGDPSTKFDRLNTCKLKQTLCDQTHTPHLMTFFQKCLTEKRSIRVYRVITFPWNGRGSVRSCCILALSV